MHDFRSKTASARARSDGGFRRRPILLSSDYDQQVLWSRKAIVSVSHRDQAIFCFPGPGRKFRAYSRPLSRETVGFRGRRSANGPKADVSCQFSRRVVRKLSSSSYCKVLGFRHWTSVFLGAHATQRVHQASWRRVSQLGLSWRVCFNSDECHT